MVAAAVMDARPLRVAAAWVVLVAGVLVSALAVAGPLSLSGLGVQVPGAPAPVKALLVASTGAVALMVAFIPGRTDRFELLVAGLGALGALSVIAMLAEPLLIALVLLPLGVAHATRPGAGTMVRRLRNPVMAAMLLGLGAVLVGVDHNPTLERTGALGLVLGLVAAAGLVPFLHRVEVGEGVSSSGLAWTAFFSPVLAMVLTAKVLPSLRPVEASVFASVCLALGLLSTGWGVLAAWRATEAGAAWRHAFIADWGLALTGTGLLAPQVPGAKATYLLLLSILLVRLPLYVFVQPALRGNPNQPSAAGDPGEPAQRGGWTLLGLLVGLALAGSAPFAGFAARLVLLQAAMSLAWPLAVLLVLTMLAYLGHCVRLGASIGRPSRRTAAGMIVVLAVSTVMGVVPGVLLAVGGY
jgi:hypothetical protein